VFVTLCYFDRVERMSLPTKQNKKMTIEQIIEKLEEAGCEVREKSGRVYINKTPNGGKGSYGYLEAGDDGSTGTCQGIAKRSGEIAAILRK
ncbi:MAG TPA: hypothetical protein PK529_12055, partial [Verrucomicrobiales bacterium]|nr:hypothetical protein [Verrucomicrobiales bacterium]